MRQFYRVASLLGALSLTFSCFSQDLTNSRQSSYYTFVYKLTSDQAGKLRKDFWVPDRSVLSDLYFYYPSDSGNRKSLPTGHYLYVHTEQGRLYYEMRSVNNVDLKLLNNHRDLIFVLNDSLGTELPGLEVVINKRKIPFDTRLRAYRIPRSNRRGIVSVTRNGHVSFFEIERRFNNSWIKRATGKVLGAFPINHLLSPIVYVEKNIESIVRGRRPFAPGIYSRIRRIFRVRLKQYSGYVVFDKPKFKPSDTVRVKAFLTTRKGKPVHKKASVLLSGPGIREKKLTQLKPYRPGGYEYEFVLHDSLRMQLDQIYYLNFRSRNENLMLDGNFKYEDYELKSNTYSVRSDSRAKNHPPVLYLKGTDSNDQSLYDVRTEVVVKSKEVNRYYQAKVFVPDTLWVFHGKLDPIGETRIALPDSIMPPVRADYDIFITFLNTENERTVKKIGLTYDTRPFPIELELISDSLSISLIDPVRPVTGEIRLTTYFGDDASVEKVITLPYREKANPFADSYRVAIKVQDSTESNFLDLESSDGKLQLSASRTSDSLFVETNNPRKIPFRYFLFRNNTLIDDALVTTCRLKRKASVADDYSVSIQYVWGGKPRSEEYQIAFQKRDLKIDVVHPPIVYPGQTTLFTVSVVDAFGRPVENADVTAFANTRKFDSPGISVPHFYKHAVGRKVFNEFHTNELGPGNYQYVDWSFWKRTLGLDSIAFYRFLFPDSGYYESRSKSGTQEFAPFVVDRGSILSAEVIYVDGNPVYYNRVGTLEPYSFRITPGFHTIELRLSHQTVAIEKIRIDSCQKLIFSVDLNHLPPASWSAPRPYAFTDSEIKVLSRYFMVVNNAENGGSESYLQQGENFHVFGPSRNYGAELALVGPFQPISTRFQLKDGFHLDFDFVPFHRYLFRPSLVREQKVAMEPYFGWYYNEPSAASFGDHVMTLKKIQELWRKKDIDTPFRKFSNSPSTSYRSGLLTLANLSKEAKKKKIKASMILNLNSPEDYQIFPGPITDEKFGAGAYQVIIIFDDEQYLRLDSVNVKEYGRNFLDLRNFKIHEADTFSRKAIRTFKEWSSREMDVRVMQKQVQDLNALHYQESANDYHFDHVVTGRIVDEQGNPIPGVNVIVKGTTAGTVTDAEGYYRLYSPSNGELVFSFIGYATQEQSVSGKANVNMSLMEDVKQLSEVVVIGFGVQQKMSMTSSVTSVLHGRVAGVSIRGVVAQEPIRVVIRGMSTAAAEDRPLIILDGVVVDINDVDVDLLTNALILKGPEASALYGSRAANGAILISRKPGATKDYLQLVSKAAAISIRMDSESGSSLRQNFRDYAFWKPRLRTGHDGKASFSATFPDDITGWNTYILGMAGKKTGQATSTIQSYKPLIAQIAEPSFLIEGDSSVAIGKITNYGTDSITVDRTITVNDREVLRGSLSIKNSRMDSISLRTEDRDSISVKYSVTFGHYSDGELRKVPVYRQGSLEAIGDFIAMDHDTTIHISLPGEGVVSLYAQADLVDVMMDEINYLIKYVHQCNEQMASRLRALLLEKQVRKYRGQPFTGDREIRRLVQRLASHQNKDGSWSWWETGNRGESWITLHVARALQKADQEGFRSAFNKQMTINFLESELTILDFDTQLDAMLFLQEQGLKIHMEEMAANFLKVKVSSTHDKLLMQRLLQESGKSPDWHWIDSIKSKTVKGNLYWSEEKNSLLDNSILNTLMVYKMIRKGNPASQQLAKIRNFLLEKRQTTWRNTYESSLILETILPDLLIVNKADRSPQLALSGLADESISRFPFEKKTNASGDLTIRKTGATPVYFTAFRQNWNKAPDRIRKEFDVKTKFGSAGNLLKAGKAITLDVEVEVMADAEYVMIEIPIPAGCSYESKPTSRSNGEVHREYFHNKTVIFCRNLKKGKYQYGVPLVPRYHGTYTLNPARAECMYFPTLYGREGMKKVRIDD